MGAIRSCTVLTATGLAVAACASSPRTADWFRQLGAAPADLRNGGEVDAMDAAAIWGVGDRVTYAIDVDSAGEHSGFTFTLTTEKLPSPAPVFPHNNPVHGGILTRTAKPEFRWYSNRALLTYHGPATVRAELNLRHRGFSPDVTTCDPGGPERR